MVGWEKVVLQGHKISQTFFLYLNRYDGIVGENLGYQYSYNPCYGYGFLGSDGCTGINNAVSITTTLH